MWIIFIYLCGCSHRSSVRFFHLDLTPPLSLSLCLGFDSNYFFLCSFSFFSLFLLRLCFVSLCMFLRTCMLYTRVEPLQWKSFLFLFLCLVLLLFLVVCVCFLSIGSEPEILGSGIRIMASEKELYISTDEEADPNSCYLQKFRLYETRSVCTYMFFNIVLRFWFVPTVLLLKFIYVPGL